MRQIAQATVLALFVAWTFFVSWQVWHSTVPPNNSHRVEQREKSPAESTKQIVSPEEVNERLAKYTFWLAIFTGALVATAAIQNYFLLRAEKTAKLAADHIPRVERAYLFPDIVDLQGSLQKRETKLNICAENVGKTPGFLKLVTVAFFEHSPGLDPVPHYDSYPNVKLLEYIVSAGEKTAGLFPDILLVDRALPFYCACCIEYLDVFRDNHTSRFLVRINPLTRDIERVGRPGWNDWT